MQHVAQTSFAKSRQPQHAPAAPAAALPPNQEELYVTNLFIRICNSNSTESALELAKLYSSGESVLGQNLPKAYQWFLFAANEGCPTAMFEVATCFYFGRGVPINYQSAFKWFSKSANSNDSNGRHISSRIMVGQMYYGGNYVAKDRKKAFEIFLQVAQTKNPNPADQDCVVRTMYSVGQLYRFGNGVEKNPQEAIKWFKKASAFGHSGAKYDYGAMLFNGEGVTNDTKRAIAYWQEAAQLNHPRALYELAILHTDGKFVIKDPIYALQCFEQSAQFGDPDANLYLAQRHYAKKNSQLAIHYYTQLAACLVHLEEQGGATAADIQKLADAEYKLYLIYRDESDQWLASLLSNKNRKDTNAVQACRQAKRESEKWLERASVHGHEIAVPLFEGLRQTGVLEDSENTSNDNSTVVDESGDSDVERKGNVGLSNVRLTTGK